ncbi:MAG: hypothetical protein QE285_02955 [Aquabacterium sp.]|nr:hypothetical protein [Aquabacterium sp.]
MSDQIHSRGDALKQAAGYALREISARPGRLLTTLQGLGYGTTGAGLADPVKVRSALGPELLRKVAEATGQGEDKLAETVGQQLGVVAVFAELDGGRLEDNVSAAENLIRSGRVDLFTR